MALCEDTFAPDPVNAGALVLIIGTDVKGVFKTSVAVTCGKLMVDLMSLTS